MTTASFEGPATVDAVEVVEAGEMFEFGADWTAEPAPRDLDPAVYPRSVLMADCGRLAAALGFEEGRR